MALSVLAIESNSLFVSPDLVPEKYSKNVLAFIYECDLTVLRNICVLVTHPLSSNSLYTTVKKPVDLLHMLDSFRCPRQYRGGPVGLSWIWPCTL
jgi:hypothetical protein